MKLFELLRSIGEENIPIRCFDQIPDTDYQVRICFGCENSTHFTCNIENAILYPWYHIEVKSIFPVDKTTIEVWLDENDVKAFTRLSSIND